MPIDLKTTKEKEHYIKEIYKLIEDNKKVSVSSLSTTLGVSKSSVSNMLKILEVNFKGINVLEDQALREGIKVFSDWPTIPQLYIKKEFVGGCDIVKEMYESGELKKILDDKGINFKKN